MRISDWSSDVCSSDLKGWDVAKYLLGHEREMISGMGLGGAAGNPLLDGAIATVGLDDNGRLADPLLRAAIAEFEVRTKAFAMTSERFIDELKAGKAHPAQPSMMKYYGTELNKRRYERSEARRVGKEGVSTCRSRWS